jgi:hypothetical protein
MFIYSLEKSLVDMAISESTRLDSLEGLGELQVSLTASYLGYCSLPRETSRQERRVCKSCPIESGQPDRRGIQTRSTTSSVPCHRIRIAFSHSLHQRPRRFLLMSAPYEMGNNHIPTFAPSTVPSRRAPPRASFILLYTISHIRRYARNAHSTRSLSPSGRDLNTQIGSRDQNLCDGDTVIGNKSHPQQIPYVGIVIDNFTNVYNQSNDQFSDIIPRGSFTRKDIGPGLHLLPLFRSSLFDSKVPVDDGEDVESLSFIFVKSLDLASKDRIDIYRDTKFGFKNIGKSSLVGLFDGSEGLSELGIVGHGQQVGE